MYKLFVVDSIGWAVVCRVVYTLDTAVLFFLLNVKKTYGLYTLLFHTPLYGLFDIKLFVRLY